MLTHRRKTKESLKERNNYILFCDSDNNTHYGNHCWVLKTELPEVTKEVIEFAANFFNCSIEEAKSGLNPEDIVNSAEMWDDQQFVSELYYTVGEFVGFRTPDGAVVLDIHSVILEYLFDGE
jgi:hypothetical protein